jgi:hypothetical protein
LCRMHSARSARRSGIEKEVETATGGSMVSQQVS